jgi:hypothetical protein
VPRWRHGRIAFAVAQQPETGVVAGWQTENEVQAL